MSAHRCESVVSGERTAKVGPMKSLRILAFLMVIAGAAIGFAVASTTLDAKPAAADCLGSGQASFTLNGTTGCGSGGYYSGGSSGGAPAGSTGGTCKYTGYGSEPWISYTLQECLFQGPKLWGAISPDAPGDLLNRNGSCSTWDGFYLCFYIAWPAKPPTYVPVTCVIAQAVWVSVKDGQLFDESGQVWAGPGETVSRAVGSWANRPKEGCLASADLGSANIPCGEATVKIYTWSATEGRSGFFISGHGNFTISTPCPYERRSPLPDERVEFQPISASLVVQAPDAIPVGGLARQTTVRADVGDRRCKITKWENGVVVTTYQASCSEGWVLTPRTLSLGFTLGTTPVGINACAREGQLGCYYWTSRSRSDGAGQSLVIQGYRATNPGQAVRIGASNASWSYQWFGAHRNAGDMVCRWTVRSGVASPRVCTDERPVTQFYSNNGSLALTELFRTPSKPNGVAGPLLAPIVGATPTPAPDRQ